MFFILECCSLRTIVFVLFSCILLYSNNKNLVFSMFIAHPVDVADVRFDQWFFLSRNISLVTRKLFIIFT